MSTLERRPHQPQRRRRPPSRRRPAALSLLVLAALLALALALTPAPADAFTPALKKAAAGALKKAFGFGRQTAEDTTTTTTTTQKERAGLPPTTATTTPSLSPTELSRAAAQLVASAPNPSSAVESWTQKLDARLQPPARAAGVAAAQLLALSANDGSGGNNPQTSTTTTDAISSTLEALNRSLGMLLSARGWRLDADEPPQQRAALDALRRYATAGVARSAAAVQQGLAANGGLGGGWVDALVDGAVLRLELLRLGPGGGYDGKQPRTTASTTAAERRLDEALRAAVQTAQARSGAYEYLAAGAMGGGGGGISVSGARKQQQQQQQQQQAAAAAGTPPATPRQRELHALVSSAAMAVDPGPGASGLGAEKLPERLAARRAWNARAARWLAGGGGGAQRRRARSAA